MPAANPRILTRRLSTNSTLFFLCDIQSVFMPLIQNPESVKFVAQRMISASQILKCPLLATEQYSKALGKTVLELPESTPVYEKMKFSMMVPELEKELGDKYEKYESVVLFGIEAHVCVQQTCLDLLEKGYNVHVVADGTSSQRVHDRKLAFERMRQAGAVISTSESVLFELMQTAKHENFKEISKLCNVKYSGPVPDPGELV